MRYLLLSAAAVLASATPALADGTRVEIHSGVDWGQGENTAGTIGGAVGQDFAVGPGAFAGVEASVDKTLASNHDTAVSLTGRLGIKPDAKDRLYALGGYTVSAQPDATHVGAGWEHKFAGPVYGSLEYRHYFTTQGAPDTNRMMAGVGLHF